MDEYLNIFGREIKYSYGMASGLGYINGDGFGDGTPCHDGTGDGFISNNIPRFGLNESIRLKING
jgi:hypothetical protein